VTPRFTHQPPAPYERARGAYRTANDPDDSGMPVSVLSCEMVRVPLQVGITRVCFQRALASFENPRRPKAKHYPIARVASLQPLRLPLWPDRV